MTTQSGRNRRAAAGGDTVSDWDSFVTNVFADDVIDRGTWYRASRSLSSFRDWSYGTVTNRVASTMLRDAIMQRRPPDADCVQVCTLWANHHAQQGVPIDEAAEVFHLYRTELNHRAATVAAKVVEAPQLVWLSGLAADWIDTGLLTVLRAYRALSQKAPQASDDRAAQLVRDALLGGGSSPPLGEFERYGLNSTHPFYAVRVRPTPAASPAEIARYLCDAGAGLTAFINGDVCGMVETLPTSSTVVVGAAGPVCLSLIGGAFLEASRALETALAFGLQGVQTVESLGLHPSVLADAEVGDALVAKYIEPFVRLGVSGEAILGTVERFLASDCALAETAKSSYLHVNTVRYRLRKFEEITGRSLRSTEVLAEVWWAFARSQVTSFRATGPADTTGEAGAEVVSLRA